MRPRYQAQMIVYFNTTPTTGELCIITSSELSVVNPQFLGLSESVYLTGPFSA